MSSRSLADLTVVNRWYGNVGTGYTITVDPVLGNDAMGAVNKSPFATLVAAIAAAAATGLSVTVLLAPGNYAGPVSLPANVSLRGSSLADTTLSGTLAGSGAFLDCLGNNGVSRLTVAVTVSATAAGYSAYGVRLNGDTVGLVQLRDVVVGVVIGAGTTAAGTVAGIQNLSSATGQTTILRDVSVNVTSSSSASTAIYGLLTGSDTTSAIIVQNSSINASTGSGIGSATGISANQTVSFRDSMVSGTTWDVAGSSPNPVQWKNSSALNQLINTVTLSYPHSVSTLQFGAGGQLPTGTIYALPGSSNYSTNEVTLYMPTRGMLCTMYCWLAVPPSASPGGRNIVIVVRKNLASTAASPAVTITATATTGSWTGVPLAFNTGDRLSVQVVVSSGATPAHLQVRLGFL